MSKCIECGQVVARLSCDLLFGNCILWVSSALQALPGANVFYPCPITLLFLLENACNQSLMAARHISRRKGVELPTGRLATRQGPKWLCSYLLPAGDP